MKVSVFITCISDAMFPKVGEAMARLLARHGIKLQFPTVQTCCGQPGFNAGYWDEARSVAKKFLNDFEGEDYIVAPSGSCTGFVRNYYSELFDNSAIHNDVKLLKKNLYEFTEFLTEVLHVTDIGATLNGVGTYHDACGALRECGIKGAPRQLLNNVKGLELTEMKECETCCGFGGTFAVKYEPISIGMAQTKVQNALQTGAKYLISTDVSCLMHLQGYIQQNNLPIQTMHIADVLASGW